MTINEEYLILRCRLPKSTRQGLTILQSKDQSMGSGPITAVVIFGAIISIVTLIVGRGSKISELRQAWINDQRTDFGKWAAAALALARNQAATSRAADLNALEEAAFRIRLRENPRKKEWKPVIDKMDAVRVSLLGVTTGATVDVFSDLTSIAELSQDRLKNDWNKVRFGELGYRIMILLFPMLFAALFLYAYFGIFPEQSPFGNKPDKPIEQHLSGSVQLIAPPSTNTPQTPTGARLPTSGPTPPTRN